MGLGFRVFRLIGCGGFSLGLQLDRVDSVDSVRYLGFKVGLKFLSGLYKL